MLESDQTSMYDALSLHSTNALVTSQSHRDFNGITKRFKKAFLKSDVGIFSCQFWTEWTDVNIQLTEPNRLTEILNMTL